MVTQLGYSDELGTVAYGDNQEEVFLGMSMGRTQNVSEATAQKIDAEVRRLVEEGYETARRILTEKKADFEMLAKALLEFETLTGDEITDVSTARSRTANRCWSRPRRALRRCRRPASRARVPIRMPAWSRSRSRRPEAVAI